MEELILQPEEKELIESWRRAKELIKKGDPVLAQTCLDHCKKIIGSVQDY